MSKYPTARISTTAHEWLKAEAAKRDLSVRQLIDRIIKEVRDNGQRRIREES